MANGKMASGGCVRPELPVKKMKVPVGLIDDSPAAAVRASQSDEAIEDYKEDAKSLPAIELFHYKAGDGRDIYLLADGRHRFKAWVRLGWPSVPGSVRKCCSRDEAERLARQFAAAANSENGLRRTNEDKRAAVRSIIERPEYAHMNDNQVCVACRVTHGLVKSERMRLTAAGVLTGRAAADAQGYKPNAAVRGGYVSDDMGGNIPKGMLDTSGNAEAVDCFSATLKSSGDKSEDSSAPGRPLA